MLDAAALLLSTMDLRSDERAMDAIKGPMLALAYGMPGLVRIGMSAGLPIEPSDPVLKLLARAGEDPPTVTVTREEYLASMDRLDPVLPIPEDGRESGWRTYAWVRSGYDQALCGLAGLTVAAAAEWTTDRPARVGRPRSLLSRPIDVDWAFDPTD